MRQLATRPALEKGELPAASISTPISGERGRATKLRSFELHDVAALVWNHPSSETGCKLGIIRAPALLLRFAAGHARH